MESVLVDVAGHRRSPATMPGYHRGRPPRSRGGHYPADPPTVEEIVEVMRAVGDRAGGQRLRALIVLLWRAGLRISEALALQESDLDATRGAILVRRGKGGKRREVGMDRWAWGQLEPWLETRRQLPIGALLCVICGPTAGRHWEASAARKQLHHAAAAAGVRRRFAPHQLRHAHAVEILDGIEATRELRKRHPDVGVIALTAYADDESVLGALRAGARGYLTKDASSEDIRTAIPTVAAGDVALDPAVQHHVVDALASDRKANQGSGCGHLLSRRAATLVRWAKTCSCVSAGERRPALTGSAALD